MLGDTTHLLTNPSEQGSDHELGVIDVLTIAKFPCNMSAGTIDDFAFSRMGLRMGQAHPANDNDTFRAAPDGSGAIKPLASRANWATAGLWGVVAANLAALAGGLWLLRQLPSRAPGELITAQSAVSAESVYQLAGAAKGMAWIVAAIVFVRWFYYVHQNLKHLAAQPSQYDSRWTIWGFVVPVVNLIRPHQLMREVWSVTSGRWDREPDRVAGLRRPADCVNLWWGMFLATSTLGNLVTLAAVRATTIEDKVLATQATLFADLVGIAAVAATLAVVRNVSALQRPLLDRPSPPHPSGTIGG